jgi:hypothetical protein
VITRKDLRLMVTRAPAQQVTTVAVSTARASAEPTARRRGDRLAGRWTMRSVKVVSCLASAVGAGFFLAHMYGPGQIASAASSANIWLLLEAVGVGAVIQIIRAQRSRWLLGQWHPVSLFHSYASMVVGHGIGDLVPIAPGGPVLRTVLTERLTGIPIAFSSGVYVLEGMLDVIAPAFLIPYLLLMLPLPGWIHWVLIGVVVQATFLMALLVVLALGSRILPEGRLPHFAASRLLQLSRQITEGLRAFTTGGPKRCLLVVGISMLLIVLTIGQLTLFLHAFALKGSVDGRLLLLVVMLSAGSIPVKIPALGTISAAAALPVAGITGPAVGGYLLTSQFVLSSESVVLAVLVLGWWFVRGIRHPLRLPVHETSQQTDISTAA